MKAFRTIAAIWVAAIPFVAWAGAWACVNESCWTGGILLTLAIVMVFSIDVEKHRIAVGASNIRPK